MLKMELSMTVSLGRPRLNATIRQFFDSSAAECLPAAIVFGETWPLV